VIAESAPGYDIDDVKVEGAHVYWLVQTTLFRAPK